MLSAAKIQNINENTFKMAIFFKRMTYRFFIRNCYERLRVGDGTSGARRRRRHFRNSVEKEWLSPSSPSGHKELGEVTLWQTAVVDLRWILLYTYTNITETIFFQAFSVYYTYIKPTQYLHLTYTISTLNEWVADSWPARRHAPEVLEACSWRTGDMLLMS